MRRRIMVHGTCWAAWAALLALGSATTAPAQDHKPRLADVAAHLELTPAGVRGWLDKLQDGSGPKAPERLLLLSETGEVLATRPGGPSSVLLDRDVDALMLDAHNAIVLVHNHPHSTSLSLNDLDQLTKPGVAAIAAVGHDGSLYLAARGPRFDRDRFTGHQYAFVRTN